MIIPMTLLHSPLSGYGWITSTDRTKSWAHAEGFTSPTRLVTSLFTRCWETSPETSADFWVFVEGSLLLLRLFSGMLAYFSFASGLISNYHEAQKVYTLYFVSQEALKSLAPRPSYGTWVRHGDHDGLFPLRWEVVQLVQVPCTGLQGAFYDPEQYYIVPASVFPCLKVAPTIAEK